MTGGVPRLRRGYTYRLQSRQDGSETWEGGRSRKTNPLPTPEDPERFACAASPDTVCPEHPSRSLPSPEPCPCEPVRWRAIPEPRDSVPSPCALGPRNGVLPRAARHSVGFDMTARHPMRLTARIWSTVPPALAPLTSRRLRDGLVSEGVREPRCGSRTSCANSSSPSGETEHILNQKPVPASYPPHVRISKKCHVRLPRAKI